MLKKICRKNGIPRWPHRKIKSLNKMIENLESSLENNTTEQDDCTRQEISILKSKKILIMKNPSILVSPPTSASKRSAPDTDASKPSKKHKAEISSSPASSPSPSSLSSSSCTSHSPSSAISISQLLTPTHPFATPLTSYLIPEDEDEEERANAADKVIQHPSKPVSPPPSSYSTLPSSFKACPSLQHHHHTPVHAAPDSCCQEHVHHRTSIAFINGPSTHTNSDPCTLPKINIPRELPHPKMHINETMVYPRNASYYEMPPPSYPPQHYGHYNCPVHCHLPYPPPVPVRSPSTQPQTSFKWVMEYDKPKK